MVGTICLVQAKATAPFSPPPACRLQFCGSRARLLEVGLRVEADGEVVVVHVLKAAKPSDCIIVVSRPGWHRLPEPVFVTPGGETIGAPEGARIELASSVKLAERISRSGTIEGWQAAVRAAVTAENCPHWTLSGAAGFAGVLVDLIKFDTCGLNESGDSSLGKTTGQQMAVSAWSSASGADGDPDGRGGPGSNKERRQGWL